MSKYRIDMDEWTITNTSNTKTYKLSNKYKVFLKTVLENTGTIASYKDFHNTRMDIEKRTIDYNRDETLVWLNKGKNQFRDALKKHIDAPAELVDYLLKSSPGQGYSFVYDDSLFEISYPKKAPRPNDNEDNPFDYFINSINKNRAAKGISFNDKYFPEITMANENYNLKNFSKFVTDKSNNIQCIIMDSSIGSGKTYILYKIKSAISASFYPIYIDTEDLNNYSLSEYILYKYAKNGISDASKITVNDYIKYIESIDAMTLIMIDGWDSFDYKQEDAIIRELFFLMNANPSLKVVIATRYLTKHLSKNICGNKNITSITATLKELPDSTLDQYDERNFFYDKITPLVATIYDELKKAQRTTYSIKDKYQLYSLYFDYLFGKQVTITSKYQEIYPYLGYLVKTNQCILNFDILSTLEEKALKEHFNIFADIPFPTVHEMRSDLIKSKLLVKNNYYLDFRHDDILDYVASQFIKIRLNNGCSIDDICSPLVEKLTTNPIVDIYNNDWNYCEFCFKAASEYYFSSNITKKQEIELPLLKLGVSIGYYTGYSVFKELKLLINNHLNYIVCSNKKIDLSILSSINDFLYESLTEELPNDDKLELISFAITTYTKCIDLLNDSQRLFFVNQDFIFGSIEAIIGYNTNNKVEYVRKALIGTIYGNLGASKIEKAKHLCKGKFVFDSLCEAISDHESGMNYKIECKISHHRNLISIATDHFYIATKCSIDENEAIKHLELAIEYYELAENEIRSIEHNTIDKFVVPINKAGCYYELLNHYDHNKYNSGAIKNTTIRIIDLLTTGIGEMNEYISLILTPQPIRRNIDNLYSDLNTKYFSLISKQKKSGQFEDETSKTMLNNFKESLIYFVEIYNLLYPNNKVVLSIDTLRFSNNTGV